MYTSSNGSSSSSSIGGVFFLCDGGNERVIARFFARKKNMMINCTGFRCYVQVCMLFQLTLSHWNWRSYCIWKPFQVSWLCEFRFMSFDSNSLNLSTENSFSDIQIGKVVWLALSRSDNSFWNFCRFIHWNVVIICIFFQLGWYDHDFTMLAISPNWLSKVNWNIGK